MKNVRAALAGGKSCLGTYITLPSPELVEIFGLAGLDYVTIDLQHSTPDWTTIRGMVRAAEVTGLAALVRVPDFDTARILRLLEIGVEGIVVPGVSSSDQIRRIADACFYAPVGHRGSCGHTRVGRYNPDRSQFKDHMKAQNQRVLLWALVENPDALLAIDSLASLEPGPSVIGVGRGDLSVALGYPGQINHPEVVTATERVIAKVAQSSSGRCVSSVMVHSADDIAFWSDRGARMFTYSADAPLLSELARGLVASFRGAVKAEVSHG